MSLQVRFTCALIALTLCLIGCDGSDDTSGVTEIDPVVAARAGDLPLTEAIDVASETLVSDLSEEDFLNFCSISISTLIRFDSRRYDPQYSCVGDGLYARFSPGQDNEVSTCEVARDDCVDSSDPYLAPGPTTCDASYISQAATCMITIAQYETCIDGIDQTFAAIDTILNCSATLEEAFELQALYTSTSPESCDPVAENCPMLADVMP
jgi:hypothetical protein